MDSIKETFGNHPPALRSAVIPFVFNLYNQGACVRCSARFLCLQEIALFNLTENEIITFYNSLPEVNEDTKITNFPRDFHPCPICLGILQSSPETKELYYKQQILSELENCGHEYKHFQYGITLPFASIIRDMGCIRALKQQTK